MVIYYGDHIVIYAWIESLCYSSEASFMSIVFQVLKVLIHTSWVIRKDVVLTEERQSQAVTYCVICNCIGVLKRQSHSD